MEGAAFALCACFAPSDPRPRGRGRGPGWSAPLPPPDLFRRGHHPKACKRVQFGGDEHLASLRFRHRLRPDPKLLVDLPQECSSAHHVALAHPALHVPEEGAEPFLVHSEVHLAWGPRGSRAGPGSRPAAGAGAGSPVRASFRRASRRCRDRGHARAWLTPGRAPSARRARAASPRAVARDRDPDAVRRGLGLGRGVPERAGGIEVVAEGHALGLEALARKGCRRSVTNRPREGRFGLGEELTGLPGPGADGAPERAGG